MLASIKSKENEAIFIFGVTQEGEPGTFIEVNDVATRLTGYSREELQRFSPIDIYTPESPADINTIMETLLREKQLEFKIVCARKDGRKIPVEIKAYLSHIHGEPIVFSTVRAVQEERPLISLVKF
ncbi:PAS domain S-box protein [Candidatus Sumerlaeota bacterium]|nr:PAS domain S-box protein [Candidatus Sumerlaeota bacterium]